MGAENYNTAVVGYFVKIKSILPQNYPSVKNTSNLLISLEVLIILFVLIMILQVGSSLLKRSFIKTGYFLLIGWFKKAVF